MVIRTTLLALYPEERTVIVAASNAGDRDRVSVTRSLAEELATVIFATPPEKDRNME
ncbi:MAG TPA: hypothetical protein VN493_19735 [Thermoanaerobaculia bacterium]|nr:hypothetical protein [Thermoanaerobaculia bacterium]